MNNKKKELKANLFKEVTRLLNEINQKKQEKNFND